MQQVMCDLDVWVRSVAFPSGSSWSVAVERYAIVQAITTEARWVARTKPSLKGEEVKQGRYKSAVREMLSTGIVQSAQHEWRNLLLFLYRTFSFVAILQRAAGDSPIPPPPQRERNSDPRYPLVKIRIKIGPVKSGSRDMIRNKYNHANTLFNRQMKRSREQGTA